MLERINAVWVGTDAPGPQPGLVLAALQQPTLRVATEEFAGVSVGWDHLGAKFQPAATSQEAVDNNTKAHLTAQDGAQVKSAHGVLRPAEQAGLQRNAEE